MSEQENAQADRAAFEALNAHDADRYADWLNEDFIFESANLPQPLVGREASRQFMKNWLTAFPDVHYELLEVITKDDYVISRFRCTGTQQGPFAGHPPTNGQMDVRGCMISQLRDGKRAHCWIFWDTGVLLRQLGILK